MRQIDKGIAASSYAVIDETMVDMLRAIETTDDSINNISLSDVHEDMGRILKKSRMSLIEANYTDLEKLAIELANKALLLGAKKMLKSIYDLQHFSRCNNKNDANRVLDSLEFDWVLVRDEIQTLSR